MNFFWLGQILRSLWGSLTGGGSAAKKDVIIEMLQTQAAAHDTMLMNHMTHMQASLEASTGTQKIISESIRENTATLREMRLSLEAINNNLAHVAGRLGI